MVTPIDSLVDPALATDEFLCSICTGVFFDPKDLPCGHSFCGLCIDQWLRRGKQCPLCRAHAKKDKLVDNHELRELCDAFCIRCPVQCGWEGRRDELGEHMNKCTEGYFADLTIPLDGPLGIRFEIMEDIMLVGSFWDEGQARSYNMAHARDSWERRIHVNDQVVQVDGIRGDADMLAYLLKRPSRRSITFRQPEELAINLAKRGKKLGLDLSWSEPHGIVTVMGIDAGAIADYNTSAAATLSHQLQRYDRIIEVNGVEALGKPDSVVPMLRDLEKLTIKFHRLRGRS